MVVESVLVSSKHPLILGDSHCLQMARALGCLNDVKAWQEKSTSTIQVLHAETAKIAAELFPLNPKSDIFRYDGSRIWIDHYFADLLTQRAESYSRIVISLEGNVHNALFMQQVGTRFDFLCPKLSGAWAPNAQIVPSRVVRQRLDRFSSSVPAKILLIKSLFPNKPIAFLAPPPPIPSEEHIFKNAEIFDFSASGLTDKTVRLKIYHMYVDMLATYCASQQVRFVFPPAECLDERGFLSEEFWAGCTHASPEYYARVQTYLDEE